MVKSNIEAYRALSKEESAISVFSQPWWLDAEFGIDNWDVALVYEGNTIVASMPFQKPQGFFKKSGMPKFGQTLGPWIRQEIFKDSKYVVSKEFDIIEKLIFQLPKSGYFLQQFNWKIKNHLPFYWKGYSQETKYTYVIKDISDIDVVINNFHSSKRRGLKKALKTVSLDLNYSGEEFYDDYEMFLGTNKIQYKKETFLNLYKATIQNNSGKIFCAKDKDGNVHSSLFVVWDKQSAFHLVTPINPKFRSSHSMTFLIVEAMRFLKDKTKSYDFEGSMIYNIENAYRKYGGTPLPYHRIRKVDSLLLRILFAIKDVLKK